MYLVWFGLAVSLSPVLWHTGSASRLLGGDSLKEYLGSSGRDDRKQEEVQDGGAWIPPPLPAVSPLTSEPRQLGRINSALTQQKKQSRAKDPLLEPSLKRAERSLKSHSWDPSHSASPAVSASPRVPSRWSLDGRKETEKEKESDLENPYVQALSRGLGGGEEDEGEGGGDFGENSSGSAVLAGVSVGGRGDSLREFDAFALIPSLFLFSPLSFCVGFRVGGCSGVCACLECFCVGMGAREN
uniref:Uncharacterized protein n=1 Tax=Chromera velia CCMP2878 TaxID=1169474 RepID=A0A0G4I4W1_9ALVE|eukprot:Cvel_1830.t1-p1 / transcript=Cvel_1830.t1 / gene=Cvel_1830 / organism=Chromera_velia_CCMP2878 / gene_product=hypothetical protein / transcript_product=hypothetical protein / location=Cvel_scaffold67:121500-122503(+) / protein_length=241 / sequence_SO=supercontig / SO=protein_coding / is_pseudo=false